MIFQEIKREDIEFLISPKDLDFKDCWNSGQYSSSFDEARFFGFIAKDGEENLGFITYTLGVDDADIESVYVFSESRKKGVGFALLQRAIEEISKKVNKIFLEVRTNNLSAIGLYEKCGFKKISIRKKYYSDGEDAIVFLKEI